MPRSAQLLRSMAQIRVFVRPVDGCSESANTCIPACATAAWAEDDRYSYLLSCRPLCRSYRTRHACAAQREPTCALSIISIPRHRALSLAPALLRARAASSRVVALDRVAPSTPGTRRCRREPQDTASHHQKGGRANPSKHGRAARETAHGKGADRSPHYARRRRSAKI
jgi:hypothetical protein